jgi:hypothetical protein
MKTQIIELPQLYQKDYYLWIEETLKVLRDNRLSELDIVNLIEEIEDMGISQKDALESNLEVLLMHLLKYKYQPNKRTRSWISTIFEHRNRLLKSFKKSPSLKRYFTEVFAECYQTARKKASLETGLSMETFPQDCPFNYEQILNIDFLP